MSKSDRIILDRILKIIARDEDLVKNFAKILGEEYVDFDTWLNNVKIN